MALTTSPGCLLYLASVRRPGVAETVGISKWPSLSTTTLVHLVPSCLSGVELVSAPDDHDFLAMDLMMGVPEDLAAEVPEDFAVAELWLRTRKQIFCCAASSA